MTLNITTTNLYLTVTNLVDLDPILERLNTMSQQIADALADLQAKVDAQTSVDQSAITLLNGLTASVAQAIADAKAAGATDAQVASFTALHQQLGDNNQALADAVAANTPAATPTP